MIRTVSELLQKMSNEEARLLAQEDISHPGLIGDMYEGLTATVLQKAIPEPLNLKVASGLIESPDGTQSRQLDCMLVEGDGTPIPHTDKRKYGITEVLAVLEVKKNLYSKDLRDACRNLLSVTDLIEPQPVPTSMVRDPFRLVTGLEAPPPDRVSELSLHHQQIHHTLVCEAMLPIRVVLAYNGFKSEKALRNAFFDLICENIIQHGFAPGYLPNLIVCGDRSLIKLNGMPYATSRTDRWDFYGSYCGNPLLLLLELLFTRLSYTHGISASVFGEDLSGEPLNRFLAGEAVSRDGTIGWMIESIALAQRDGEKAEYDWQPHVVDRCEFAILNILCNQEEIDTTDPEFLEFIAEKGRSLDSLIDSLRDKRLATVKNERLILLTDECGCIILPNGEFIAAENNTGRLERWLARWMAQNSEES